MFRFVDPVASGFFLLLLAVLAIGWLRAQSASKGGDRHRLEGGYYGALLTVFTLVLGAPVHQALIGGCVVGLLWDIRSHLIGKE